MRLKAAFQSGSGGSRPLRLAKRNVVLAALALTMISGAGLAEHAEPAHAFSCPHPYEYFETTFHCAPAQAGFYANGEKEFLCSAGTWSPGATTYCINAEPGYYDPHEGEPQPFECSPGTYAHGQANTNCTLAPPGTYVRGYHEGGPTNCQPGSYQPSSGQIGCNPASAGYYSWESGAFEQKPCNAGTYQPSIDQQSCLSAQKGFFVSSSGSSTETPCPAGDTTAGPRATSASECFLKPPLEVDTAALLDETPTLPGPKRGSPYTYELKALGEFPPYKWKKVGTLPKGMKLSKTGVISGTPSTKLAAGLYSIGVKVTDSKKKGKDSATATLMMVIT